MRQQTLTLILTLAGFAELTAPVRSGAEVVAVVALPKVAVISRDVVDTPQVEALADLLVARLAARTDLALVERQDIARVLDEQQLDLLFAPEAGGQRVEAGQLIKADLLVMIRKGWRSGSDVEIVISETIAGLRLTAADIRLGKVTDETVSAMVEFVDMAVQRLNAPITTVFAVPPFADVSLAPQANYMSLACAKLVEEALRTITNAVVVEFDEAESLRRERELVGTDGGATRPMPFYILGTYRHNAFFAYSIATNTISLSAELKMGNDVQGSFSCTNIEAARLGEMLLVCVTNLLGTGLGRVTAMVDATTERNELEQRAALFQRLGATEEALSMLEARLLLSPSDSPTRVSIVKLISEATVAPLPDTDLHRLKQDVAATLDRWRRGVEHMEYIVRAEVLGKAPDKWAQSSREYAQLLHLFVQAPQPLWEMGLAWCKTPGDRKELNEVLLKPTFEERRRLRETCVRALEARKPSTEGDRPAVDVVMALFTSDDGYIFDDLARTNAAIRTRVAAAIQGMPDLKPLLEALAFVDQDPEFSAMIDGFGRLKNPQARQIASALRKRRMQWVDHGKSKVVLIQPPTRIEDELIPIRLPLTGPAAPLNRIFPTGWLRVSAEIDLVWERHDRHAIYLVRKGAAPATVYRADTRDFDGAGRLTGQGLFNPCFDGKHIWAPFVRSESLVVVIDPATGENYSFGAADGVPPMNRSAAAIEIGPGKVCLVASFESSNQARRTWVAVSELSPTKTLNMKIIHEAIEQPGPEGAEPSVATTFDVAQVAAIPSAGGGNADYIIARRRDVPMDALQCLVRLSDGQPSMVKLHSDVQAGVLRIQPAGGQQEFTTRLTANVLRLFPDYAMVNGITYWFGEHHLHAWTPAIARDDRLAIHIDPNVRAADSSRWILSDSANYGLILLRGLAANAREAYQIDLQRLPPDHRDTPVPPPAFILPDPDKWAQVKKDMTELEVFALLGRPCQGGQTGRGSFLAGVCTFGYPTRATEACPKPAVHVVWFKNGKVSAKNSPFMAAVSMDGLPTVPTVTGPADGSTFSFNPRIADLRWDPSAGAYPLWYEIETRLQGSGADQRVGIYTTDVCYLALAARPGKNEWRIRAVNSLGASAWSALRTMTFDGNATQDWFADSMPLVSSKPDPVSNEAGFVVPPTEAWNSIKPGMSVATLVATLGEPWRTNVPASGTTDGRCSLDFGYVCGSSQIFPEPLLLSVLVTNGVVVDKKDPFSGEVSNDGTPTTPKPMVPEDGAVIIHSPAYLMLRWHPSAGQYPMSYEVEYTSMKSTSTSQWGHNMSMAVDRPCIIFQATALGNWRWRVRAVNDQGVSEWSEYRRFSCPLRPDHSQPL